MELEPPDFSRLRFSFRGHAHPDTARALERACSVGELERRPVIFSHRSAAAVLGLPSVAGWPRSVELLVPKGASWRNSRGIRVHEIDYEDDEIMPWGPFFVTSAARTIADLARGCDLMTAAVAFDAALSPAAQPWLRLVKSDVAEVLERQSLRGLSRARFALGFADGRAANAGESASRVVIYQLGYEIPDLQVRHFHAEGYFDVDFKWRRSANRPRSLIGEFDGAGKYLKPEYLGSLTPGGAVLKEKRREDILRRQDNDFARWGWPEVRHPTSLDRILRECGLTPVRRRLI